MPMSQTNIIGNIHYSHPRAIKVKEDSDPKRIAVHGSLAVYVETKEEAEKVIHFWEKFITGFSDEMNNLL